MKMFFHFVLITFISCSIVKAWATTTPARFYPESVAAALRGTTLYLNWTSRFEKGCVAYSIEGAADSSTWEVLGTVGSKAPDGHSNVPQVYTFCFTDTGTALAGIAFLFTLLLIPTAPDKKIRGLLILVLLVAFIAGSGKISRAISTSRQIRYVRILQLDIHGHTIVSEQIKTTGR